MAVTGTGKWAPKASEANTSVQDRDYYSGKIASFTNTTYDPTKKIEFGFLAMGVIIKNPSATELQFQWLRHLGDAVDNGTVAANSERQFGPGANKPGLLLRSDTGGAIANVEVTAYG